MTVRSSSLSYRASFLLIVILCGCSKSSQIDVVPPIGAKLTRSSVDWFGRFHAVQSESGFRDGCSRLMQDLKTGGRYVLVTIETINTETEVPRYLIALGDYAPVSADTFPKPPKAQFRVDCLKSVVVDSSVTMARQLDPSLPP